MLRETDCYLLLESISRGKVVGCEVWDRILLDSAGMSIGRAGAKDARPDIEIAGNESITRNDHARIEPDPEQGGFRIIDCHSKNGTCLNGRIMAKNQTYLLEDDTEISLSGGQVVFRYRNRPATLPPGRVIDHIRRAPEGVLTLDAGERTAIINSRPVKLTRLEYSLLEYLYQNDGSPCSWQDIGAVVWAGKEDYDNYALVAKYVSRLRKKLGDDQEPHRLIVNIKGHGLYKLAL